MSKPNDKIKGIFEEQKVDLPSGFWDSIEPNIPTYPTKKRRFLGLPLMGCLFISAIGLTALAGLGYYLLYDNNSPVDQPLDEPTQKELIYTDEDGGKALSAFNYDQEKSQINESVEFGEKTEKAVENLNQPQKSDVISVKKPSTTINHQTQNKHIKGDIKSLNPPEGLNQNDESISQEDALVASTNEVDQINDMDNPRLSAEAIDPNVVKRDEESLDIMLTPLALLNPKLQYDLASIEMDMEIIDPAKQPLPVKGKFFSEIGYNSLFLNRKLTSTPRDLGRIRREKYERPFVSHEVELKGGKYFSKHFYTFGGVRYTRIQELFDYRIDSLSTANFKLARSYRRIEHTNTMNMVDLTIGLGLEKSWSNWGLGVEVEGGYNLAFSQSGRLIDQFEQIKSIGSFNQEEGEKMFKDRTRFNLGLKLTGLFSINRNIDIKASLGLREYLSSFTSKDWSYTMNYQGVSMGVALRYRF